MPSRAEMLSARREAETGLLNFQIPSRGNIYPPTDS
jgi:hypothetical protein